jgi:hypothetical protein
MSDYFGDEFMRLPTADDLKGLVALHKEMHGVPGMFWIPRLHAYILEELSSSLATIIQRKS